MDLHHVLETYIHKLKIQILFKDIDKQGHVNNANHITYFETARVDYF
jgi:acyl-CoA thioesterase FadM